jgi:hypothetical protein
MQWRKTDGTKESLPQKDCLMVVSDRQEGIVSGTYYAGRYIFAFVSYVEAHVEVFDGLFDMEICDIQMDVEKDIYYIPIPDLPE